MEIKTAEIKKKKLTFSEPRNNLCCSFQLRYKRQDNWRARRGGKTMYAFINLESQFVSVALYKRHARNTLRECLFVTGGWGGVFNFLEVLLFTSDLLHWFHTSDTKGGLSTVQYALLCWMSFLFTFFINS